MCRMLGIVAAQPVALSALLNDAPRSLAALSKEHPDGWGIASTDGSDWSLHKSVDCAALCPSYERLVRETRALLAIAHVRQKTVGGTSLVNTHPFRRGILVFAHNGTVGNVEALARSSSKNRLHEIEGETDSERLFAFVLTRVDDAPSVESGVTRAVRDLRSLEGVGAASFLFSDGQRLYAHRLGRTLYALTRAHREDAASRRTRSVVVASERLTDEPWQEIAEGALVVIEQGTAPRARVIELSERGAQTMSLNISTAASPLA